MNADDAVRDVILAIAIKYYGENPNSELMNSHQLAMWAYGNQNIGPDLYDSILALKKFIVKKGE